MSHKGSKKKKKSGCRTLRRRGRGGRCWRAKRGRGERERKKRGNERGRGWQKKWQSKGERNVV